MPANRIYIKILLRTPAGEWYVRREDGGPMLLMLRTPRPLEAPIAVARLAKADGWTATTYDGCEYRSQLLTHLAVVVDQAFKDRFE